MKVTITIEDCENGNVGIKVTRVPTKDGEKAIESSAWQAAADVVQFLASRADEVVSAKVTRRDGTVIDAMKEDAQ